MCQVHYIHYISFSQSTYYIHFILDVTIAASASMRGQVLYKGQGILPTTQVVGTVKFRWRAGPESRSK